MGNDMGKVFAIALAYTTIICSTIQAVWNGLTVTYKRLILRDPAYTHAVRINWGPNMNTLSQWDHVTIWGLEHFGLPGGRYITDLSADHMTWIFQDPRDALVFRLKFAEVTQ